jgi:hypothetical protein
MTDPIGRRNDPPGGEAPLRIGKIARRTAVFLLLAGIFALVYTQYPLYSSNQNQYFLHGLAASKVGFLPEDWLARTVDPTPVFSGLVQWTYALFHTAIPFYAFCAVLLGVYFFSMRAIVSRVFSFSDAPGADFLFCLFFLFVHSALFRFGLSTVLGPDWSYLLEGGVAGQRILGTVIEPSMFGVLLILAVAFFLQGRSVLAAVSAGLAAAVHPTYLLAAAVLTVLPILLYVSLNFLHSPSAVAGQARDILVRYRIPHHAMADVWWNATACIQVLIAAAGLLLARKSRLFHVLGIAALAALILTAIQIATQSDFLALLFPWRLSVVLVPLASCLILGRLALALATTRWLSGPRRSAILRAAGVLLVGALVCTGLARTYMDFSNQWNSPDRRMMSFVQSIRASGQVFLIPVKMEDFRLATGAPVYIDHKSIPYLPEEVMEWYRRVLLAGTFINNPTCDALDSLRSEGMTHLVIPTYDALRGCDGLENIYGDDDYQVYRWTGS